MRADLPERIPRADIAPAHLDRHDGGKGRVLHHRVIDRIARRLREGVTVEAEEIEIALRLGERVAAGGDHGRLQPLQLVEEQRREQEDAAVPQIVAGAR